MLRADLLCGYASDETVNRGAEPRYGYECLYGSAALRQLRRWLPVVEIEIEIEIEIAIEIENEYDVE